MLIFYVPVALGGFLVFGTNIKDNVIANMDSNWLKTSVIILITGHLFTAFNIILNPVFQGLEKVANAPEGISLKRVIIRIATILAVLFVAQSIPNFGPILSFIGGSGVSLTSFILPCVFYILICRRSQYSKHINDSELILLAACIMVSVFGGAAAIYSSLDALFSSKTFVPPCYFNRTQ
jgi:solute carrier family 32 (vesicular inhibitory amino acid transporter)